MPIPEFIKGRTKKDLEEILEEARQELRRKDELIVSQRDELNVLYKDRDQAQRVLSREIKRRKFIMIKVRQYDKDREGFFLSDVLVVPADSRTSYPVNTLSGEDDLEIWTEPVNEL